MGEASDDGSLHVSPLAILNDSGGGCRTDAAC